jgi:hypothetical protein
MGLLINSKEQRFSWDSSLGRPFIKSGGLVPCPQGSPVNQQNAVWKNSLRVPDINLGTADRHP